jgi:hypothetical protein
MEEKSLLDELRELGLEKLASSDSIEVIDDVIGSTYVGMRPDRDVGH